MSLPSVFNVVIVLVVRFTWFGQAVGSIAEGGMQSAGASMLVLWTAVPIALMVSPFPVIVLYILARRESKLRKLAAEYSAASSSPTATP